jgi:hypothetical protein
MGAGARTTRLAMVVHDLGAALGSATVTIWLRGLDLEAARITQPAPGNKGRATSQRQTLAAERGGAHWRQERSNDRRAIDGRGGF